MTTSHDDCPPDLRPLEVGPGLTASELQARQAIADQILADLLAMRKAHGQLTVGKFSQYGALVRACGGHDLTDAFNAFKRELRYMSRQSRNVAAAVHSVSAPADTVLDRLQITAETLSPEEWKDQRTARRWADAGMPIVAEHLAYLSLVQGRLGRELLNIRATGSAESGMAFTIDQLTLVELPSRSPMIEIWLDPTSEHPQALPKNHYTIKTGQTQNQQHNMQRVTIRLLPEAFKHNAEHEDYLSISVSGVDAPMRSAIFEDHTERSSDMRIRWAHYRTIAIATIERQYGQLSQSLP